MGQGITNRIGDIDVTNVHGMVIQFKNGRSHCLFDRFLEVIHDDVILPRPLLLPFVCRVH